MAVNQLYQEPVYTRIIRHLYPRDIFHLIQTTRNFRDLGETEHFWRVWLIEQDPGTIVFVLDGAIIKWIRPLIKQIIKGYSYVGFCDAFSAAARVGDTEIAELLLLKGHIIRWSEWNFHVAVGNFVEKQNCRIIELIASQGNLCVNLGIVRIAVLCRSKAILKTVFKCNLPDSDHKSLRYEALTLAAENGMTRMVKFLLENGSSVDTLPQETLFQMMHRHHYKLVNYLIQKGARFECSDEELKIYARQ